MNSSKKNKMAGEKQDVVVEQPTHANHTNATNGSSNNNTKEKKIQKQDLWQNPLVRKVSSNKSNNEEESIVHMTGVGSDSHTVFARVAEGPALTVGAVVDVTVDAGWKQVAKDILEKRQHIATDSYPPAQQLLQLGAVWLCNETLYTKNHDAHAHRLSPDEEESVPDWKDMTLRVHYMPDRFHAAAQYDWTKYCRGLLVGNTVHAKIGEEVPHVPVPGGLPDTKDGVIVYEVSSDVVYIERERF